MPDLEDVRAVAPAVLRHRLVPNFQAEADGRATADLVDELIQQSRKWT
jgi:MoxR-like ATPase